jgi:pantoate--beta-alanine ligase
MKILETISGLQKELNALQAQKKTIGFVPTMGALHEGHLTLVRQCAAENDVCVVSIFVNPTQFNNKSDLENYPRTLNNDAKLLEEVNCSIIFAPAEKEIYPEPDTRTFDFGKLGEVMEGKYRPGHFNGVAQVVSRLFDMVKPDRAYFGEKDFQQLAIIREMVKQYQIPVEIVGCPIVREADGMALSSRNMRLSKEEREKSTLISRTLLKSCNFAGEKSVAELKKWVVNQINEEPLLEVEYFDIVDASTLQSINDWDDSQYVAGCITVYCGEVRLIDNVQYKK